MDNPINTNLMKRALDMALLGCDQAKAPAILQHEFTHLSHAQVQQAVRYAYQGEPMPNAPHDTEKAEIKAYNKRKARKAMIMLKVNYKNADHDAVTDCIADLLHHCHAKGIDYTEAEESGRMHFNAELVGGEHG